MKLIHFKLLLTAIFWGGTFIAGRMLSDHVAPFSASFLRFVIAAVPLLYMTYRIEGRFPPIQKETFFYLGFFGTVLGFVWYYEGIKKLGPSKASLFINFVPISAIILAFLFLDEPITTSLLTGAAMVSLGVYLTNTRSLFQLR